MSAKQELCRKLRRRAVQLQRGPLNGRFRNPDLKGMCGLCAIAVFEAFVRRGWHCRCFFGKFYPDEDGKGKNHCWVDDGEFCYDITATQFGREYSAVYIVASDSEQYEPLWEISLESDCWRYAPKNERPTHELVALILEADDYGTVDAGG